MPVYPSLSCALLLGAALFLPARAQGQITSAWTPGEYVAAALAASPDVKQIRQNLAASEARWKTDLSDSILPSLSASANAYPYGLNPLNGYKFNSWQLNRHDLSLNGGLTWNLFNSFADYLKLRYSHLSKDIAKRDLDVILQSEALKALSAYYDLLLQTKLLEVRQENLQAQKAQYQLTADLYNHGMKSLSDLLKTETDMRSSELGLAGAEADQRLALFRFNALIDREGQSDAALNPDLALGTTAQPPLEADMRRALLLRPEMVKSRLDAEKARTGFLQSLQGALPSLNIGFQWNYQESATFGLPSSNFGITNPNHFFSLALSLPTSFNFISQIQRTRAAKADERASLYAVSSLTRKIREEVFSAHNQLTRSHRSYDVSLRKTEIAKQNLDLVLEQYRQGSADVIRLSQAQVDYVNAQEEHVLAFRDANISRAEYRLAVGEPLWQ